MENSNDEYEFQFDKYLIKNLLTMKNTFKKHYNLFQQTIATQQNILEKMWILSQRFLILTRGFPCVRPYPRDECTREERHIRKEFQILKLHHYMSNSKSITSLLNLKEECSTFDNILAKIDTRLPSRIMEGGNGRQSINYYIGLFRDIFMFLNEFQNKSNMLGKSLMVDDIVSILEYKLHLEPDGVVNTYFETCLDS